MLHIYDPSIDPEYVTPLNIAVKAVVEMIVQHDFSNSQDTKWQVLWLTDPHF